MSYKIYKKDSKIPIISTSKIDLSLGDNIFYIYTLSDFFKFKVNIIELEKKLILRHSLITHNDDGDAYLLISSSDSTSNIYYKNEIMLENKEINPVWIWSSIYIYKTRETYE